MQPLLRIQNVPISIEYNITRASLRHSAEPARVSTSRARGRANIRTTPAKVNLDTTEAKASIGLKSAPRSIQEFAQTGKTAAAQATREYAENGNQIVDSHGRGNPIADIAASKMMRSTETAMAFIPSAPVEMMPQDGSISFDYSMDKLTFDWNINTRPQMEYVPGGIEFAVAQYPQVIIEYTGGPIYAPPSADPNYQGPALDAIA